MNGLIEGKYMDYIKKRGEAMNLKKEVYDHYIPTCEYVPYTIENGFWNKADIVYNDDVLKNSYDSFTVFASRGKRDDVYDVLISQFKVLDFKIADDLIWVKKSNDYFQFFKQDGEEFIKRPKIFTEDQVKALIEFFKVLGFKFIAEVFGIEVKMPGA